MFVSLLLVGSSLAAPQLAMEAASQTIVDGNAAGLSTGVNRIIGGIISYARWPADLPRAPRTMCVAGAPQLTDHIAPAVPGGQSIAVRRLSAPANGSGCDILFLGRMPVADRQRLIAWVRGRPVLTITDDDPGCSFGAMFCLRARAPGVSFSVNLDAIGRGPLRIDPRVLQIGSDGDAS